MNKPKKTCTLTVIASTESHREYECSDEVGARHIVLYLHEINQRPLSPQISRRLGPQAKAFLRSLSVNDYLDGPFAIGGYLFSIQADHGFPDNIDVQIAAAFKSAYGYDDVSVTSSFAG